MIKVLAVTLTAALLATTAASAGTVTFGQFSQQTAAKTFKYVNRDTAKKGVITPAAEIYSIVKGKQDTPLVTFTSLVDGVAGSGVAAGQTTDAFLSFDATSAIAASDNGSGNYSQVFDGSFSFTDANSGANILTGNFTGAVLSATTGAFSLAINGSSTTGGGTLDYTSDLFNLGLGNDFTFAATGLSRAISYSVGHSLNYKPNGFQGNLTGTFSTVPTSTPEPAVIALFGLGLLGLGAARRRR